VPSTIDIRRRIRSVKNTQQITKAMKMVAAAKLRRAHDRIVAARPYAGALREVLRSVASRVESDHHPLLSVREERNVCLIVVTADKGLCGAFNTNIIKAAQTEIRERGWENVALIPVGRKGNDFFRRRDIPIRHQAVNIFQALTMGDARDLARIISDDFISEKVDAIYVIYNQFKSVIQQNLTVERLLPIERLPEEQDTDDIDYIYEPAAGEILAELLPKHLEMQIYRILLESAAAEHGARMTAMEAATKNAGELIDSLTLTYNRTRQAAITREIIEVVSGAAALG
jgi:ATP synthase, F1 gamma subunit